MILEIGKGSNLLYAVSRLKILNIKSYFDFVYIKGKRHWYLKGKEKSVVLGSG